MSIAIHLPQTVSVIVSVHENRKVKIHRENLMQLEIRKNLDSPVGMVTNVNTTIRTTGNPIRV